MKIACVDRSAHDRLALQKRMELAFSECRRSIGHLAGIEFVPNTADELLINQNVDLIIVGPGYSTEQSYQLLKEISSEIPAVPLALILNHNSYTLRTLKRFEHYATEIFSDDDSSIKLVHKISLLLEASKKESSGKLIVVQGVKGGVGTTSIVSGLSHAAESANLTAIIFDLSSSAALLHYVSAAKWHSPDYATILNEKLIPDRHLIDKLITTAPNGINLLLPPSGGSEVREMFLRDPDRFEITLSIVDILRSIFDLAIVDCANAEGVLPYALLTQAHSKVLVTSNDPASVHLLNQRLSEVMQIPGEGTTQIFPNMISDKGLTKEDIIDFLSLNNYFDESMSALQILARDIKGANWIGTGNSFYTEGSTATQLTLEENLRILLLTASELAARQSLGTTWFGEIKRISSFFNRKKEQKLAIPLLRDKSNHTQPLTAQAAKTTSQQQTREHKITPGDLGEIFFKEQFSPPKAVIDQDEKISNG